MGYMRASKVKDGVNMLSHPVCLHVLQLMLARHALGT